MILHLCVHECPRHQCTKQYMYLSRIFKKNDIQTYTMLKEMQGALTLYLIMNKCKNLT